MIQKKVCMVGTSGVGKTSLVAKFVHSIFSDKYLTAVGVKIDKKTVTVDGNEVMLMIWDLAGDDVTIPITDDGKIAEIVACGQREVARSGASLRVGAASEGAEIKFARAISL
jgi:nucleoside-triphosphatase THEP1